jgi:hypothetical protein
MSLPLLQYPEEGLIDVGVYRDDYPLQMPRVLSGIRGGVNTPWHRPGIEPTVPGAADHRESSGAEVRGSTRR